MAVPAPPLKTNRAADKSANFVAGASAVNLTTVSGKPNFGPQLSYILGGAASGTATVVDESGQSLPIAVAAGQVIPVPVTLITVTSLATCSMISFWYFRSMGGDPHYFFPLSALNP